ncbi:DNA polymerase Y family protein [Salinibacterium sp. SWN167]|uniref:DNA polymerase Y family protein n=1 Tax=Salinibacterium sp. SWN167 TaxID=2792054 RepID=UPI0018CCA153|nr:DNA polymerase Y family protein [Salinibacterium sp. SWN167]MBH0083510.1 DNA polymerase Y family protein [Salinibacterium sp. SWN167]
MKAESSQGSRADAGALPESLPRVLVLWAPDWPVVAARQHEKLPADAPLVLVEKGLVFAAAASARAEGVTRGLRLREAQSRFPGIIDRPYDPALDSRAFEPVLAGIEELIPGVQVLRPGMCAVRVRGAALYYGGEKAAALTVIDRVNEIAASDARVGIADALFTAVHAARSTSAADPRSRGGRVRMVPAGSSAEFLAPLPIAVLEEPPIVTLLMKLGISTLGEFAHLDRLDVRTRFGELGGRLHALASGRDPQAFVARTPPLDLDVVIDFEPALDRVDQVAFGIRSRADDFVAGLVQAQLVATAIRIELDSESGEVAERVWLHPRSFSASDVVDRVRWQVQGSNLIDAGLSSGISRVRIVPETVDEIGHHETGLWGSGLEPRIHHGLSRVQSMLGHGGVLVPTIEGGRTLQSRQRFTAWGDRSVTERSPQRPWPGVLPAPLPGTVFSSRHAVHVFAEDGTTVSVDARGHVAAPPAQFSTSDSRSRTLTAWAGPWPLAERWWEAESPGRSWRFQAVDDTGCAWLLVLDDGGWWAEARYD